MPKSSNKVFPIYSGGHGIHDVINELRKQAREMIDEEHFYKEHGFASCFECDETFEDLDALAEHQMEHLVKERTLG
jgi:hypothetical protein|tara:strand:+ start:973 stop:1200 length:228 start_codon:yes stop_codon:yes gene_type:complete